MVCASEIHTVSYGFDGRLVVRVRQSPRRTEEVVVALVRTPRTRWVDEGLRALASGGPDSVRVEALARLLGVSKGGFYWHFPDRQALLEEMLVRWETASVDEAIERVEASAGTAREKLARLFSLASSSDELRKVDLAVRDWARREPAVAERLGRIDNRRMEYMRLLFGDFCADRADVEARCLVAMTMFVGLHFVHVDHGPHRRAEVLQAALERLVR
jgi:AcrR family transcriptional regulator